MRKLYRAIVLSILSILLISSVALAAWTFKFPTIVQDTSGVARTYYPVDLGYDAATLLASGKIAANGLNTNMQVGSEDVGYMMDTTRVMAVIPTLGADAMATVDLYTGYTPNQTSFDVVVGEGGYITTGDDADIELGSSFDITLSGYFDTSADLIGENILYKQDSIRIYVQAAGTIRAAVLSAGDVEEKVVDGAVSTGEHEVRIYTSGSTLSFGLDGSRIAHTSLDPGLLAPTETAVASTTAYGMAYSYTHQNFYAKGRFWVFWCEGGASGTAYYQTSTDGSSWESKLTAFTTSTPYSMLVSDIHTDGTYIYIAYCETGDNVAYRKGTLNADGTISWIAPVSYITTSGKDVPHLGFDSQGNVYVGHAEDDDQIYLDKCLAPANTWVSATGFPKQTPLQHDPAGSGSIVILDNDYVVVFGDHDGSATYSDTSIFNGSTFSSAEVTPFKHLQSMVSYGNDVYAASGDDVYKRTYGVGWGAATDLGTEEDCHKLSIDKSSGNMYMVRADVGLDIIDYKKYDADTETWDGAWTTLADESVDGLALNQGGLGLSATESNGSSYIVYNYVTNTDPRRPHAGAIVLNDNPVPDTANDYVLMDGNTMAYASEISFTINGTETLLYQPNTIVVDTALPDRATTDGSQDGTITWGSNSDVTITYGLMEGGSGAPTAFTPSISEGFDPGEAAMPDAWFGTCSNASNLPFYESFYEVSTQTGQSVCDIYFLIMVGVAFGVFLLLTMTTRSALIGTTGFNIVLFAASSTGMVPMWIPFATTVVQVGVMFLYKQVAY